MKFRQNEEAVSPVIGTILMVAITVILAAVIAAFVFGMGTPEKTPTVQLSAKVTNSTSDNVLIQHKGGDLLQKGDLKIIAAYAANGSQIGSPNSTAFGTGTFSAGDLVSLNSNATFGAPDLGAVGSQVTIQVVHIPTNSFLLDAKPTITN